MMLHFHPLEDKKKQPASQQRDDISIYKNPNVTYVLILRTTLHYLQ